MKLAMQLYEPATDGSCDRLMWRGRPQMSICLKVRVECHSSSTGARQADAWASAAGPGGSQGQALAARAADSYNSLMVRSATEIDAHSGAQVPEPMIP
jgi:hypothetical protein